MRIIELTFLLIVMAVTSLGQVVDPPNCYLRGEWQLTDAGTKNEGRVVFTTSTDGKPAATYKGSGPTPMDQFHPWQVSKIYCDPDFITFQVASWGEFWFFRKENANGATLSSRDAAVAAGAFKWVGRFRSDKTGRVSEAVFFSVDQPR